MLLCNKTYRCIPSAYLASFNNQEQVSNHLMLDPIEVFEEMAYQHHKNENYKFQKFL